MNLGIAAMLSRIVPRARWAPAKLAGTRVNSPKIGGGGLTVKSYRPAGAAG